jgi:hypothetical protein
VHDDALADEIAAIEDAHRRGRPTEATRAALTATIRDRYLAT